MLPAQDKVGGLPAGGQEEEGGDGPVQDQGLTAPPLSQPSPPGCQALARVVLLGHHYWAGSGQTPGLHLP